MLYTYMQCIIHHRFPLIILPPPLSTHVPLSPKHPFFKMLCCPMTHSVPSTHPNTAHFLPNWVAIRWYGELSALPTVRLTENRCCSKGISVSHRESLAILALRRKILSSTSLDCLGKICLKKEKKKVLSKPPTFQKKKLRSS